MYQQAIHTFYYSGLATLMDNRKSFIVQQDKQSTTFSHYLLSTNTCMLDEEIQLCNMYIPNIQSTGIAFCSSTTG